MTTISAKVVADSISADGIRLTTYVLVYPAFFHQDLMTHRMFSRNASSTRAIPIKTMMKNIRANMAMPIHWGVNKPGMQASEELTGWKRSAAQFIWRLAGHTALWLAWGLNQLGAHKQVGNMILWPFMHFTTIVSSTNYANFFALRNHKDARPEIKALAQAMIEARDASTPKVLEPGQWHLPFVTESDYILAQEDALSKVARPKRLDRQAKYYQMIDGMVTATLAKVSAARCARVSYLTHDGQQPSIEKDLLLHDRLVGSSPLHASPTEHQATPDVKLAGGKWKHPELHGNFTGYNQYRKSLQGEYVSE